MKRANVLRADVEPDVAGGRARLGVDVPAARLAETKPAPTPRSCRPPWFRRLPPARRYCRHGSVATEVRTGARRGTERRRRSRRRSLPDTDPDARSRPGRVLVRRAVVGDAHLPSPPVSESETLPATATGARASHVRALSRRPARRPRREMGSRRGSAVRRRQHEPSARISGEYVRNSTSARTPASGLAGLMLSRTSSAACASTRTALPTCTAEAFDSLDSTLCATIALTHAPGGRDGVLVGTFHDRLAVEELHIRAEVSRSQTSSGPAFAAQPGAVTVATSASTTCGSKSVPAQRRSSRIASATGRPCR